MKHELKLKVGDLAPDFDTIDHFEKIIRLSDFKDKKVILYFYPKDSTPGCTAQACDLTNNLSILSEKDYVVLGVSADKLSSHINFAKKNNIKFSLLIDEDKMIINKYGVWGIKHQYGREYEGIYRTTFIIDENQRIERIIEKVDTKNHVNQILENK